MDLLLWYEEQIIPYAIESVVYLEGPNRTSCGSVLTHTVVDKSGKPYWSHNSTGTGLTGAKWRDHVRQHTFYKPMIEVQISFLKAFEPMAAELSIESCTAIG